MLGILNEAVAVVGSYWRHKVRGTRYQVVNVAEASCDISEGDAVVIYLGSNGSLWVRKRSQFLDGRFERLK